MAGRQLAQRLTRAALGVPSVVQAGNPTLRRHARDLSMEELRSPQTQRLIAAMKKAVRAYDAYGLAAPQIGVDRRIFVMEVSDKHLQRVPPELVGEQRVKPFPLKVFCNPRMKITNKSVETFREGCLSVAGYSAVVKRYAGVRVTALDENGAEFSLDATGWSARIIQHEMDHLDGNLYIDRMDTRTFTANEELHHITKIGQ